MSNALLELKTRSGRPGHPWRSVADLDGLPGGLTGPVWAVLEDEAGRCLGTGVLDLDDRVAAWRRFSAAGGVAFDPDYFAAAIHEAIGRRADEAVQRLISSDADFLPGLVVERYGEVLWVEFQSRAVRAAGSFILEVLESSLQPLEMVVADGVERRTASGQGLKARWIEVDDLAFRVDLLGAGTAGFPLVLREQHALVGSLCAERRLLDAGGAGAGFALQAMRTGAEAASAVHPEAAVAKAMGANAQKNQLRVEAHAGPPLELLEAAGAAAFDAVVIDLGGRGSLARPVLEAAFAALDCAGLLAVYAPLGGPEGGLQPGQLLPMVAQAAHAAGREARLFARTSQPFDFPQLLGFPESVVSEGVILEVL